MPTMDRPRSHWWCFTHHAVEIMEDPETDREPSCYLAGPFDSFEAARQHGVRRERPADPVASAVIPQSVRSAWNILLEDIPGL